MFNLLEFQQISRWDSVPLELKQENIEETVTSQFFPGGIVTAWVDGETRWYAFALDQPEWRKLQPVLTSYIGHTISTFTGEPSNLDTGVPVEAYLLSLRPYAVAKLIVPGDKNIACQVLQQMKNTLMARPSDLRPLPLSTARIIANFDMCLVDGDRKGAERWLDRLHTEHRLDAINISFSRVKLMAAFRDWRGIIQDRTFIEMCRLRKPGVISFHLFEAIWFQDLEALSQDQDELEKVYKEKWLARVSDVLASSPTPNKWTLEMFGTLFEKFNQPYLKDDEVPFSPFVHVPGIDIPEAADGEASRTPLKTTDQKEVTHGINVNAEKVEMDIAVEMNNWSSWLRALEDRSFSRFREYAEELALSFEKNDFDDPVKIDEFANSLLGVSSNWAGSRMSCSLPILIKWLKLDPDYPRSEMSSVYESLLILLSDVDVYKKEYREAASEMMLALLEVGLSESEYVSLLREISKLVPSGAGVGDIFWLLDTADNLCRYSAANEGQRQSILNHILSSLGPVLGQMTEIQIRVYSKIAEIGGWPSFEKVSEQEDKLFFDDLKGKLVGIYTLTEKSGQQAAKILREIFSEVKVEVSSDKVCTPRLKSLSKNADIFVVTTSSAKHAATDCINQNRPSEKILYAAGRGSCSILRTIEESLM